VRTLQADEGRLAFEIISVEGKPRDGKHYIDIPLPLRAQKHPIGTTHRFWAYETVGSLGYPHGAFEKIGEPPFATVRLHLRPELVVLKDLQQSPIIPQEENQ